MSTRIWAFSGLLFLLALVMASLLHGGSAAAQPDGGITTRVSVASDGTQANHDSYPPPAISTDGRYVAFVSDATNLVSGDTNASTDIFVRDRVAPDTVRVSVATGGAQAWGGSGDPSVSADGHYVAFNSYAALVPDDTNGDVDTFLHDLMTGVTSRVSVASSGAQGYGGSHDRTAISGDGRYVAFATYDSILVPDDTNGATDVFVHDRVTGETTRVSVAWNGAEADNFSICPAISADGRYVVFYSLAHNLVPGDTNWRYDVFVRDRWLNTTERVSVSTAGDQGNHWSWLPSISADGRYVTFMSFASNLVPGDTNGYADIFVRDREANTTVRVSVSATGAQGNNIAWYPAISADGRYVAWESAATTLVPGGTNGATHIFVHDRSTGEIWLASVTFDGVQANGGSARAALSGDGRKIAFGSGADNLVPGDTNQCGDIYVREPEAIPVAVAVTRIEAQAAPSPWPALALAALLAIALTVAHQSRHS